MLRPCLSRIGDCRYLVRPADLEGVVKPHTGNDSRHHGGRAEPR